MFRGTAQVLGETLETEFGLLHRVFRNGIRFHRIRRFIVSRAPSAAGRKFRGIPVPPVRRATVPHPNPAAIADGALPTFPGSPHQPLRPTVPGFDPGPRRCAAAAPAAPPRGVLRHRAIETPDGWAAASTCDGSGTDSRSPAAPILRSPPDPSWLPG